MSQEPIVAAVDMPDVIFLPEKGDSVEVTLLLELRNPFERGFVVSVPKESDIHFWQILDQTQREVLRGPAQMPSTAAAVTGEIPVCSKLVPGRFDYAQSQTIELNTGKLKNDRAYTLRYLFWGWAATADFTAAAMPKPPAGPARKATAKAKATPKRAEAKKTTSSARKRRPTKGRVARG